MFSKPRTSYLISNKTTKKTEANDSYSSVKIRDTSIKLAESFKNISSELMSHCIIRGDLCKSLKISIF